MIARVVRNDTSITCIILPMIRIDMGLGTMIHNICFTTLDDFLSYESQECFYQTFALLAFPLPSSDALHQLIIYHDFNLSDADCFRDKRPRLGDSLRSNHMLAPGMLKAIYV